MFGFFCWIVLSFVLEMPFWVLAGVLLGLILVDLDSCKSKVGRKFWFLSWVFSHRGIMHSLVGCFVVSAGVGMINLWFGFGVFVGFVSHLVLDVLTLQGVKIFWPFDFRVRGFVRSGGIFEDIFFVLVLLVDIIFGVYKFL